eukprot:792181-Rhodomonas_salina.1
MVGQLELRISTGATYVSPTRATAATAGNAESFLDDEAMAGSSSTGTRPKKRAARVRAGEKSPTPTRGRHNTSLGSLASARGRAAYNRHYEGALYDAKEKGKSAKKAAQNKNTNTRSGSQKKSHCADSRQ